VNSTTRSTSGLPRNTLEWLADNHCAVRFFEDANGLQVRVGAPLAGGEAAVAVVLVGDPVDALSEAVEQVRADVEALDRRARLALA
jgi:hypothetical protein